MYILSLHMVGALYQQETRHHTVNVGLETFVTASRLYVVLNTLVHKRNVCYGGRDIFTCE